MNARTRTTAGAKSAPLVLPVVSSAAGEGEQGGRPGRAAFAVHSGAPAKSKGLLQRLAALAFVSAAVWWAGTWLQNSVAPELLSLGTSPPFTDAAAGVLSGAAGSNGTLDKEEQQQYKRAVAILRPPVVAKYSGDGCAHVSGRWRVAAAASFSHTGGLAAGPPCARH